MNQPTTYAKPIDPNPAADEIENEQPPGDMG